jgi:hypothetical protein
MHHPIFPTQMEDFLVAALSLWRITHLLNVEEGPFRFVARLRLYAGSGFFGGLLDCFYCLSLWLAIPLAVLVGEGWAQQLLLWLALSGAACLLEKATRRTDFPGIFEETKE